MIWVSAEDVILIHGRIIQTTGGLDGLRDRGGLEAALAAPLQSFDTARTCFRQIWKRSQGWDMGLPPIMPLPMAISASAP